MVADFFSNASHIRSSIKDKAVIQSLLTLSQSLQRQQNDCGALRYIRCTIEEGWRAVASVLGSVCAYILCACVYKFYSFVNLRVVFQNTRRIKSFFPYKDRFNRPQKIEDRLQRQLMRSILVKRKEDCMTEKRSTSKHSLMLVTPPPLFVFSFLWNWNGRKTKMFMSLLMHPWQPALTTNPSGNRYMIRFIPVFSSILPLAFV